MEMKCRSEVEIETTKRVLREVAGELRRSLLTEHDLNEQIRRLYRICGVTLPDAVQEAEAAIDEAERRAFASRAAERLAWGVELPAPDHEPDEKPGRPRHCVICGGACSWQSHARVTDVGGALVHDRSRKAWVCNRCGVASLLASEESYYIRRATAVAIFFSGPRAWPELFRAARVALGKSLAEMARECGTTVDCIESVESGKASFVDQSMMKTLIAFLLCDDSVGGDYPLGSIRVMRRAL
jgi:hypothetical protein